MPDASDNHVKTALKIVNVSAVLGVIALAVIFVLLGGPERASLRRQFDSLVRTNEHQAVAVAAIAVIEATTNQMVIDEKGLTNLPERITRMRPRYVVVSPESMKMEFHGGFDHFGFQIKQANQQWEMTWYTEKRHHLLLTVDKTDPSSSGSRKD